MKAKDKNIDNSWEDMAFRLSGDYDNCNELPESYSNEDDQKIFNYLKEMKNSRGENKTIVDNAWGNLLGRLKEDDLLITNEKQRSFSLLQLVRVAAMVVIVASLSITGKYFISLKLVSHENVAVTSLTEKNLRVELPDGSIVYLNRNSELTYPGRFGKDSRGVKLVGEAFFDISPNADKPFIIDAGDAQITVLGTSFNVITDNGQSEVEVMVQTGMVSLASPDGRAEVTLEPGTIGTISNNNTSTFINNDPNYLSWNTEILTFNGETLDKVFKDLKRVHNIVIVPVNEDILNRRLNSVYYNTPADTIIAAICKSFNLTFEYTDKIYYLSVK